MMSNSTTNPPTTNLILTDRLPEPPQEFTELQVIVTAHPDLFSNQAQLLRARFDALITAGFSEEQAIKVILRWGLKHNLTDS